MTQSPIPIPRLAIGVLLVGVVAALVGCGGGAPPGDRPVPRLPLGQMTIKGVEGAYGPPRQATENGLWYVGPDRESLTHGHDGWMALLTFDDLGYLRTQEFLRRGVEQNYVRVDYWIADQPTGRPTSPPRGRTRSRRPPPAAGGRPLPPMPAGSPEPFGDRDRELDFDRQMIGRCVRLAEVDPNYLVTANEPDLFVLSRVLPGENEPVVQWQLTFRGQRAEVSMWIKALPRRDEPLMRQAIGAIGERMMLIEVVGDAETAATEHAPRRPP